MRKSILAAILLVAEACVWGQGPEKVAVKLLTPPDNHVITSRDYHVTFSWEAAPPEAQVCFAVVTDKGRDPTDGGFEEKFSAGKESRYTANLSQYWMNVTEWAVEATLCNNKTDSCPCTGRVFWSDVRVIKGARK